MVRNDARTACRTLIGAVLLAATAANASSASPRFEDYPARTAYRGTPAPPILTDAKARKMRTQLRQQASRGPDFAGSFTVARWGCGAGCADWAIVDARSGAVWLAPFEVMDAAVALDSILGGQHSIDYRLGSELVVIRGSRDGAGAGAYYYRWHGGALTLLHADERRDGGEAGPSLAAATDTVTYTVAARFAATDTTEVFDLPLGSSLRIRVRREPPLGWDVSVIRGASEDEGPNLLYESLSWHGPHPTQVYAWSHQSRLFPDERVLPVYGHPYEVRIRLLDCRTSGTGEGATFAGGTIEVAWRPAPVRQRIR